MPAPVSDDWRTNQHLTHVDLFSFFDRLPLQPLRSQHSLARCFDKHKCIMCLLHVLALSCPYRTCEFYISRTYSINCLSTCTVATRNARGIQDAAIVHWWMCSQKQVYFRPNTTDSLSRWSHTSTDTVWITLNESLRQTSGLRQQQGPHILVAPT